MEFFHQLIQMLLHLMPVVHPHDGVKAVDAVGNFVRDVGPVRIYVALFAIIFCETGLVVLPFLPGDSLLFAIGAVAAGTHSVSLPLAALMMCLAANCGDLVNYIVGYRLGPKVFHTEKTRFLNKKHLLEAQHFYEKHGRKTIIIARFVPIIRTFAPFVAGIGRMSLVRFAIFSVTGGILWVNICLMAGYLLARIPFVKEHFEIMVLAVIAVSLIPVVVSYFQARGKNR